MKTHENAFLLSTYTSLSETVLLGPAVSFQLLYLTDIRTSTSFLSYTVGTVSTRQLDIFTILPRNVLVNKNSLRKSDRRKSDLRKNDVDERTDE